MCTAISVVHQNHYFGRNLDYEHTFGEKVTITPRNYPFKFTNGFEILNHSAIIGMALPYNKYPLYFDACNESGVCMAGLNFPGNAFYFKSVQGLDNVSSYEFIPWVLTQCHNLTDVKILLSDINITDTAFSENLPNSPLHWMISDNSGSLTVEQTKNGIEIYDNPVGVLTNNPCFDVQLFNLNNFMSVSNSEPENRFSDKIDLKPYSKGMGGIGIPGDLTSMSRFVRACFVKLNSVFGDTEKEIISHFFHILYSVYQIKGCAKTKVGYEFTNYSSCCNADKGIYYYTTYNNSRITQVDMYKEDLDSNRLVTYDLIKCDDFFR